MLKDAATFQGNLARREYVFWSSNIAFRFFSKTNFDLT
jgi:hypothetical protein